MGILKCFNSIPHVGLMAQLRSIAGAWGELNEGRKKGRWRGPHSVRLDYLNRLAHSFNFKIIP